MYRILFVLITSLNILPAIGMAKEACAPENQCIEMNNWDLGIAIGWGQKAIHLGILTIFHCSLFQQWPITANTGSSTMVI